MTCHHKTLFGGPLKPAPLCGVALEIRVFGRGTVELRRTQRYLCDRFQRYNSHPFICIGRCIHRRGGHDDYGWVVEAATLVFNTVTTIS